MAKRPRTERREKERRAVKLAEARLKLALLEEGGAADRPIEVASASVVEVHALGLPCAACGEGPVRVEDHAAVTTEDGRRLRRVRVACTRCGVRREIWFRIGTPLPS